MLQLLEARRLLVEINLKELTFEYAKVLRLVLLNLINPLESILRLIAALTVVIPDWFYKVIRSRLDMLNLIKILACIVTLNSEVKSS